MIEENVVIWPNRIDVVCYRIGIVGHTAAMLELAEVHRATQLEMQVGLDRAFH